MTSSVTLQPPVNIGKLLKAEGRSIEDAYSRTPLDFIRPQYWAFSICMAHVHAVAERCGIGSDSRKRPIDHISNSVAPPIPPVPFLFAFLGTQVYFAILLLAWNHRFPTMIEGQLWRISSVYSMASCLVCCCLLGFSFHYYPQLKEWRKRCEGQSQCSNVASRRNKLHSVAEKLRNNSRNHDPFLRAPLHLILICWILGSLYLAARFYIWVEDFLELRNLEKSAYQTVDWSWVLPHVG